MGEATIPVDLYNPGQVFACLGFMEAAEVLVGGVEAAFDWSVPTDTRFALRIGSTLSDENPFEVVLRFLDSAEVVAQASHGSANFAAWGKTWGAVEELRAREPYPFAEPQSPATLPAALRAGGKEIVLDHWGDSTHLRDNVKFWAGAGGYPGAGLTRDALELVRGRAAKAASDPFALTAPQSSSFRLDWRRDYIPIDAGFSLNAHSNIATVGYPLVELCGAIGLTHARPARVSWRDKLQYRYGVIGRDSADALWFPLSFVRAALGGGTLPFPSRRFHMSLGWPGKKDQARSITTVIEETAP